MKLTLTIFAIVLAGIVVYSYNSGIVVQSLYELTISEGEKIDPDDGLERKKLKIDSIQIPGGSYLKIILDDKIKNKKPTLVLFPKGITQDTQYTISDSTDWQCIVEIKDTTTGWVNYAIIFNYDDPDNSQYVTSKSAPKIRIN